MANPEDVYARTARAQGGINPKVVADKVTVLENSDGGSGGSDIDLDLLDERYYKQEELDPIIDEVASLTSQIANLTNLLAVKSDLEAIKYNCEYITFSPFDVADDEATSLVMPSGRLYMYWLPVSANKSISGLRLPVKTLLANGTLSVRVFNDEGDPLTGVETFVLTGAESWNTLEFDTPISDDEDGMWVAFLFIGDTGPALLFPNHQTVEPWTLNSVRKTALYENDHASIPADLPFVTANNYVPFCFGLY